MRTSVLPLALWLLVPVHLAAQEPQRAVATLGLAEAVAQATGEHPHIRAAEARVASAEGMVLQGGLKPNPRLILQSENTPLGSYPHFSYGRDVDSFAYGSMAFETGGKRQRRVDYFSAGVRRIDIERQLTAYQIAHRVSIAYWNTAGAEQNREVLRLALENFKQIVQYNRDRVREGALAEADLIRVVLEQDRMTLALRAAEQEAVRARIQLFREMGKPNDPAVRLSDKLDDLRQVDPIDPAIALERRLDLQSARQQQAQTEANLALQRANAKPNPEVLAGYKRTAGFNTLIAGVQVDLPVRNRNQGQIASATAEIRAASATLAASTAAARSEMEAAREAFERSKRVLAETFPQLRESAEEASRIAEAAYREGGTDLLRLLDARRALIDTDILYYRALLDYQLSAVELKAAQGTLQ